MFRAEGTGAEGKKEKRKKTKKTEKTKKKRKGNECKEKSSDETFGPKRGSRDMKENGPSNDKDDHSIVTHHTLRKDDELERQQTQSSLPSGNK